MGTFDYKFRPTAQAIRYCVKYLTKGAWDRLPAWCKAYAGVIRAFTASRGFWHDRKHRNPSKRRARKRDRKPLGERMAHCEVAGTIGVEERVNPDGELVRRFGFAWAERFEHVKDAAAAMFEAELGETIRNARSSFVLGLAEFRALAEGVLGLTRPAAPAADGTAP